MHFGADPDILVDAYPHIGTNKLPKIITAMSDAIIAAGGQVHFNSKMTDIIVKDKAIKGIQIIILALIISLNFFLPLAPLAGVSFLFSLKIIFPFMPSPFPLVFG